MKKQILAVLAICLCLCLVACGEAEPTVTTQPTQPTQTSPTTETQPDAQKGFGYAFGNVVLTPGESFDAAALPEALSRFEAPSCAFQGVDITYSYENLEIVTYDEGKGEKLYSIYFLTPDAKTAEGLSISATRQDMITCYGQPTSEENGQCIYRRGDTELAVLFNGDTVISIEYRLVTGF